MRNHKVTTVTRVIMFVISFVGVALAWAYISAPSFLARADSRTEGGDRHSEDSAVEDSAEPEFRFSVPDVNPKSLNKLSGHPWDNKTIRNKKGEVLGTIEKVMVDRKGGKETYAMLKLSDDMPSVPIPLKAIKEEGFGLVLNATKEQLKRRALSSRDKQP